MPVTNLINLSPALQQDIGVIEDDPTYNGNLDHVYGVRVIPTQTRRAILRFASIASIPAGSTITSALLTLDVGVVAPLTGGTTTISVHVLTRHDGVEPEITWLRFKVGSNWTTPGGDYLPTLGKTSGLAVPATAGFKTFQIKDTIQYIFDNFPTTVDILIKFENESAPLEGFWYFKDATTGTAASLDIVANPYTTPLTPTQNLPTKFHINLPQLYTSGSAAKVPPSYLPPSILHAVPGPSPWLVDHDAVTYPVQGSPTMEAYYPSYDPPDLLITDGTFAFSDGTISDGSSYWGILPSTSKTLEVDLETTSVVEFDGVTGDANSPAFEAALLWRGRLMERINNLLPEYRIIEYSPFRYDLTDTYRVNTDTQENWEVMMDSAPMINYFNRMGYIRASIGLALYYPGLAADAEANLETWLETMKLNILRIRKTINLCTYRPRLCVFDTIQFLGDSGNGYPIIPESLFLPCRKMLYKCGVDDILLWDQTADNWLIEANDPLLIAEQKRAYAMVLKAHRNFSRLSKGSGYSGMKNAGLI